MLYGEDMTTETSTAKEHTVETLKSPWMSKAEATAYLGVSDWSIDRYVKSGQLTRYKLGGTQTVRFRREDIEALLVPEGDHDQA
jgi:excisionase family DNA binding protein